MVGYFSSLEEVRRKMYWAAFSIVRNPEDAEDIVQDSFVKILRNMHRYNPGISSFSWWCTVITRNKARDFARKVKIIPMDLFPQDEKKSLEGKTRDPYIELVSAEGLRIIEDSIESLDPQKRETLTYFLEGMSYRDIAKTQNIPQGTVSSRLNGARNEIREILNNRYAT
jgi:RNA polymerase sigma-70 factor (ECF subfamily)